MSDVSPWDELRQAVMEVKADVEDRRSWRAVHDPFLDGAAMAYDSVLTWMTTIEDRNEAADGE